MVSQPKIHSKRYFKVLSYFLLLLLPFYLILDRGIARLGFIKKVSKTRIWTLHHLVVILCIKLKFQFFFL